MSSAANEPRTRGLRPGAPIEGDGVLVPGSKSIAQRAIVCATLAGGTTRITNLPDGDDVRSALEMARAVGAALRVFGPAAAAITGRPPGPERGWRVESALEVGESGTLARLATAVAGLCGRAGREIEIQARGTLRSRRSVALFEALRTAGVACTQPAGVDRAGWPVTIAPRGAPSTLVLHQPASSQEVSALLVAAAAWPDAIAIEVEGPIPSRPYLEMTLGALRDFGVTIQAREAAARSVFLVRGPLRPPDAPLAVEPDASAAAVLLAAGCLSGGAARVSGLTPGTRQGDARIVEHLLAFGCEARLDEQGLWARGAPTRGAALDLEREPDLAPVLAAVAARAALDGRGPSRLVGLGTLPGKESSRIEVLAEGLRAIGLEARASAASLDVERAGRRSAPVARVELDPRGDHRMAFAFALLGLCVDGVDVREPGCVSKSWPGFWSALERAGLHVVSAAN